MGLLLLYMLGNLFDIFALGLCEIGKLFWLLLRLLRYTLALFVELGSTLDEFANSLERGVGVSWVI